MAKNVQDFSSSLSEKIWGHRFKDGQRGPEYVLEFLNVLYGTDYRLGANDYFRVQSVGLRKFIFEGVKEGSKQAVACLEDEKKQYIHKKLRDENRIEVVREFFRNLEIPLVDGKGKEVDRSWYARTLYPIHESLLFFELRVKANEKPSYERNFFARGGELYYLMISYGTKDDLDLRKSIENRFRSLLTKNVTVGNLIKSFEEIFGEKDIDKKFPLTAVSEYPGEYPTLPDVDMPIYKEFAIELYQLLKMNIDIYDMFKQLISLICFQLMRYMYERSKSNGSDEVRYFFDCTDGKIPQIQKISSDTFKMNERLIKEKFENYFNRYFFDAIGSREEVEKNLPLWKDNNELFLKLMGLSKLQSRKARVISTLNLCNNYYDVETKLLKVVREVISDSLKKHQLSINRVLARDGGIGNFKTGISYRYLMTDTFLQALVFINVEPNASIEYSEFLDKLFKKYGFIIGEKYAKLSGLYDKSKLNVSYFNKNELALREKLKKNGLLVEYSDATAMIHNPYDIAAGVGVI